MKTIANSLVDFWTCSLYSLHCCCLIAHLAAVDGHVSIFHCEKVASDSWGRADMEGGWASPIKNMNSPLSICWRGVEALSSDNCATDYDLIKCYSIANNSVGKLYITAFQCNKCLFASTISAPLFNQVVPRQSCKWCRGTETWGTLMRRDISNSAVVSKWFMSCDEPLSAS